MKPSNPEIPEYEVLSSVSLTALVEDVNKYIQGGWQPYMAPAYHSDSESAFWYQAVLYVPPDPVAVMQREAMLQQLRAHGATGIVTP